MRVRSPKRGAACGHIHFLGLAEQMGGALQWFSQTIFTEFFGQLPFRSCSSVWIALLCPFDVTAVVQVECPRSDRSRVRFPIILLFVG